MLTKEQRLEDYKKALAMYESGCNEGICIVLGEMRWGNFFDTPFALFAECKEYYPELKGNDLPKRTASKMDGDFTENILTTRITILQNAIKLLESC